VTSYPIEDNLGHWWLTTSKGWNRLHAIPAEVIPMDDEDAVEDLRSGGVTTTARCGVTTRYSWPGVFTRLGCDRCAHCCRVLGIPAGHGTPGNEKARLEREGAST